MPKGQLLTNGTTITGHDVPATFCIMLHSPQTIVDRGRGSVGDVQGSSNKEARLLLHMRQASASSICRVKRAARGYREQHVVGECYRLRLVYSASKMQAGVSLLVRRPSEELPDVVRGSQPPNGAHLIHLRKALQYRGRSGYDYSLRPIRDDPHLTLYITLIQRL